MESRNLALAKGGSKKEGGKGKRQWGEEMAFRKQRIDRVIESHIRLHRRLDSTHMPSGNQMFGVYSPFRDAN